MSDLSPRIAAVLQCPACRGELSTETAGMSCTDCGHGYSTSGGARDLRPPGSVDLSITVTIGDSDVGPDDVAPLRTNPSPAVDFSGIAAPRHLTRALLSYFPRASTRDALALDLGCGTGIHREVCERAGYEWVGVDYDEPGAPIFGDAHRLPFRDDSFEFILSVAVLEHIQFPAVMLREARRVLKPGGLLIGTVAFLEPFHQGSYYHHSHRGTSNSLRAGGFQVTMLASTVGWSVLRAQAEMKLFPRLPSPVARAVVTPVELLHRAWWRMGRVTNPKATELVRSRDTAGSFVFIAS